jgi:hypothetical protein
MVSLSGFDINNSFRQALSESNLREAEELLLTGLVEIKYTDLCTMIRLGTESMITHLINVPAIQDFVKTFNYSPIQWTVLYGKIKILTIFLTIPGVREYLASDGEILNIAISVSNKEMVNFLLTLPEVRNLFLMNPKYYIREALLCCPTGKPEARSIVEFLTNVPGIDPNLLELLFPMNESMEIEKEGSLVANETDTAMPMEWEESPAVFIVSMKENMKRVWQNNVNDPCSDEQPSKRRLFYS